MFSVYIFAMQGAVVCKYEAISSLVTNLIVVSVQF